MKYVLMRLAVAAIAVTVLLLGGPAPVSALNPAHLSAPASGCTTCHTLHNAPGSALQKEATTEVLCLTCHGPAGPSVLKADVHRSQSCMGCHTPHSDLPNVRGGVNLKLIGRDEDGTGLARILTPQNGLRDVAFESRGTGVAQPAARSFADGDGTYDGICEVCHTQTNFHRNNPTALHNHEPGATCSNCHKHEEQFKGSCTTAGCHAPGGALDPLTIGGTGINGKHVTHVTGKGQACATCHSGYFSAATHRDTVLNGKADTVSPVAFNPLNPLGAYTDQSPSGSGSCAATSCHQTNVLNWYAATATPTWPTVCTNCHGAGSAIDPLALGGTGTSGKHGKHVTDRGIGCGQCHTQYTAAPQTTAEHMNGRLDAATSSTLVGFSAVQNTAGLWTQDAGAQTGSCANLWCHGATGDQGLTGVPNEPGWYDATAVPSWAAGTIYALDTIVVPTAANGRHYKAIAAGVSGVAEPPWPTGFKAQVLDGTVAWKAQTATAGLPCESCHSAGSFVDPLTLDALAAPPAGKHAKHVSDRGYACSMCHNAYNQAATHVNFQFDAAPTTAVVTFDTANAFGTWSTAATTCAGTYCHGAKKDNNNLVAAIVTPSWYATVGAGGLACTACHSRTTPSFLDPINRDEKDRSNPVPAIPDRGLHKIHVQGNSVACAVCHALYRQKDTHANLNEVLSATYEAMLRWDLIDFDPLVSATPASPDSYWGGDAGTRGQGGCGGSLCHYPGKGQNHSGGGFINLPGPLAGWYNR